MKEIKEFKVIKDLTKEIPLKNRIQALEENLTFFRKDTQDYFEAVLSKLSKIKDKLNNLEINVDKDSWGD